MHGVQRGHGRVHVKELSLQIIYLHGDIRLHGVNLLIELAYVALQPILLVGYRPVFRIGKCIHKPIYETRNSTVYSDSRAGRHSGPGVADCEAVGPAGGVIEGQNISLPGCVVAVNGARNVLTCVRKLGDIDAICARIQYYCYRRDIETGCRWCWRNQQTDRPHY